MNLSNMKRILITLFLIITFLLSYSQTKNETIEATYEFIINGNAIRELHTIGSDTVVDKVYVDSLVNSVRILDHLVRPDSVNPNTIVTWLGSSGDTIYSVPVTIDSTGVINQIANSSNYSFSSSNLSPTGSGIFIAAGTDTLQNSFTVADKDSIISFNIDGQGRVFIPYITQGLQDSVLYYNAQTGEITYEVSPIAALDSLNFNAETGNLSLGTDSLTNIDGRYLLIDDAMIYGSPANVYEIVLPPSSTVGGRLQGVVEGVNYPEGWTLQAGSNLSDLDVTHGLGKRVSSVNVFYNVSGTTDRQLINFTNAYTGLLTPDVNSLRIEGVTTIQ